jgi:NAD(P)-dependent dehydrogenase (short-subunit alcohol dehydrogenase family)
MQVASIKENEGGGGYAYRCSKIAANMATKSMSIDLAPKGITCTILHPGYVRTKMTDGNGLIEVDESVEGMLKVLESGVPLNGEWYHMSGRHLPW